MNSPRRPSAAKSAAFTLIELLTVIAIIGILAALIIPTIGSVRKAARTAKTVSNGKQVGMAMMLYAQDNKSAILAHSYNPGFPTTEATYRQLATYLIRNPNGAGGASVVKEKAVSVLASVADAGIPDSLIEKPFADGGPYAAYKFTWSFNVIFNYNSGRSVQGVGGYDNSSGGSPRKLSEFLEPSRTLYALSGNGYEVSAANIVDASLTNPTENTLRNIGYYHHSGQGAAAIFLDGHTAILDFPINPKLTKIKTFD